MATHPLFDPASRFNRLRRAIRSEDKMRGYFLWLAAQKEQEEQEGKQEKPDPTPGKKSPSQEG